MSRIGTIKPVVDIEPVKPIDDRIKDQKVRDDKAALVAVDYDALEAEHMKRACLVMEQLTNLRNNGETPPKSLDTLYAGK